MARPSTCMVLAIVLSIVVSACGGGGGAVTNETGGSPDPMPTLSLSENESGVLASVSESGFIDRSGAFFQPFGNGRRCSACHVQEDAWSLTPMTVQKKFEASDGKDPLFLPHDTANSPFADVSTVEARRIAYSMLLNKALIRMQMPIPQNAEFVLEAVDDPYGYASAQNLSLFRRSMPSANTKFQSTLMWDGRETHKAASTNCFKGTQECYADLDFNLGKQANNAVLGHAQGTQDLTPAQMKSIVEFQKGLFTAQVTDKAAMSLTGANGNGGPLALLQQQFYFGINDLVDGDYQTQQAFNPRAMNLYSAWTQNSNNLADPDTPASQVEAVTRARQSIARGQMLFNSRSFTITNVGGLNDDLRMSSMTGSCTTCHSAPNAGSHSTPRLFNTGISDGARRTSDMPLYTLKNIKTGEIIQTTDPGAALQTGKWRDVGRFKVPSLRALAARAPYFHNGSAKDLGEVVDFYNTRFNIGLTTAERNDLIAFLKAL